VYILVHFLTNNACNRTLSRDGHETLKLETERLTSRDHDVGFTSRDETEMFKFRDETETFIALETFKVQVLLIAITGLDVIFHVHCF